MSKKKKKPAAESWNDCPSILEHFSCTHGRNIPRIWTKDFCKHCFGNFLLSQSFIPEDWGWPTFRSPHLSIWAVCHWDVRYEPDSLITGTLHNKPIIWIHLFTDPFSSSGPWKNNFKLCKTLAKQLWVCRRKKTIAVFFSMKKIQSFIPKKKEKRPNFIMMRYMWSERRNHSGLRFYNDPCAQSQS